MAHYGIFRGPNFLGFSSMHISRTSFTSVVALMVASSFGLPVPEEVTLMGLGLVCYIGSRPVSSTALPVRMLSREVAALVALLRCFSDYWFSLGKNCVRLMKRVPAEAGKLR